MNMNWKGLFSTLLFTASLAAMIFSGYEFCGYLSEEARSDSLRDELAALHSETLSQDAEYAGDERCIQKNAAFSQSGDGIEHASDAPEASTKHNAEALPENTSSSALPSAESHGIAALNARNRDCIGWISIDGTAIDYPVMHRPSQKDYYLYRDFNGRKSYNGTLYASEICDPETSDNVILYGHNMRSGKMFAALTKYKEKSFYEAHRYIVFETLNGVHIYEVMFALTTPVYTGNDFEYYSFADAADAQAFDAYLSACASRALYDTGVTAAYGDHLLTLCTCEYSQDNGRMLVVAKRIDA